MSSGLQWVFWQVDVKRDDSRPLWPGLFALPLVVVTIVLIGCVSVSARASEETDRGFRHWTALRDQQVIRQEKDFSCGLAALATVLTYYFERPVTEAQLLDQLELPDSQTLARQLAREGLPLTDRERLQSLRERGVSLALLARLARTHGLRARGVSLRPEALSRLSMPAIAYVEPGGSPHFTLIRGVDQRGHVQVADPSWGNRLFTGDDFAGIFAPRGTQRGRLLLLLPSDAASPASDWFRIDRPQPLLQPR